MKKLSVILSVMLCLTFALTLTGCKKDKASTSYAIEMTLTDDMHVIGKETVNYKNEESVPLAELRFNLFAKAYRKGSAYPPEDPLIRPNAFPNGASYGDMSIKTVMIKGEKADFSIVGEDENVLSVKLKEELFPDEKISVTIEYEITLANIISRTGYNEKTVNLGNCYPILCVYDNGFYECEYYSFGDPFYSECADYLVSITLPSGYVIASSGELKQDKKVGEKNTFVYKINSARSFAMVVSKGFKVASEKQDKVTVNYYYYNDETPSESLQTAKKALKYFSATFGDYPYSTYSVVQTPFVQGGMEYSSLVLISDTLNPQSIHEVIVHETAHQWWQVVVGNNEIEHAFLDESLAEYSVVMFYEKHPEYGLTRKNLMDIAEQTYKIYCSVYEKLFGETNTKMVRPLKEFDGEYEYVNIAYIKGCIMFDCLRQTVGEEDFVNGIKKYYKDNRFKVATPNDLMGAFEKTGADTNGFFRSFFDGKVIL